MCKSKILILFISLGGISYFGCRKFVTLDPPANLVTAQNLFQDETAATSAVLGEYIQIRTANLGLLNGGLSVYSSLSADDIENTASNSIADPFRYNELLPNNNTINISFWGNAYRNIYQVNALLEGLSASAKLNPTTRNQLLGEMRLVRAVYYFYLSKIFGDVPLITNTNYEINQSLPRTSREAIEEQILADLLEAKQNLATSYIGAQHTRPNKWCAAAFLARYYLYTGNWQAAIDEADSVINSGQYMLESDLSKVFLPDSKETLWQLARDISNTAEGTAFVPYAATARPTYVLTDSLLRLFPYQDNRRTWIDSSIYRSQVYYYPAKYKARGTAPVLEYLVMIRLAELYLIRAEANYRLHHSQEAADDLNIIRTRAGLSNTTYTNEDDLFQAVLSERRKEFFAEWGHRWLDLKRLHLAETVLAPIKTPYWQPTDTLYPIPQLELDRNPYLVQNPGY